MTRNCTPDRTHPPTRRWVGLLVLATAVAGLMSPAPAGAAPAAAGSPPLPATVPSPLISHRLVAVTSTSRLAVRAPDFDASAWRDVGHAYGVTGVAHLGGLLWATTSDNRLWFRMPNNSDTVWQPVGITDRPVTALAADTTNLFALTDQGSIQMLNPLSSQKAWIDLGPGPGETVTAMTVLNGTIWATTTTDRLWRRPAGTSTWIATGHANNVTALATIDGRLWATTSDDNLWVRSPSTNNVSWALLGRTDQLHVTEMTAVP